MSDTGTHPVNIMVHNDWRRRRRSSRMRRRSRRREGKEGEEEEERKWWRKRRRRRTNLEVVSTNVRFSSEGNGVFTLCKWQSEIAKFGCLQ